METSVERTAGSKVLVMLTEAERVRLEELAREENVSTTELVHRAIHDQFEKAKDEEMMRELLALMNQSLDKTLETVQEARVEIARNLAMIRATREGRDAAA